MNELILLTFFLLLNSSAIFGFHIATNFDFIEDGNETSGVVPHSKMILWKVRYWCIENLGWFWSKPVCLCPPCMSSLHSLYFYPFFLTFVHFETKWILFWPVYVLILAGINYFVGLKTSEK